MSADDAVLAAWLSPADPSSGDAAAHDALRAEIDELGMARGRQPDWEVVEALGTAQLRGPRKDLRVATYVAAARTARDGVAGAVLGMRLLSALLGLPDDALQPARPRARAMALAWYLGQTLSQLSGVSADARGDLTALRGALDALLAAAAATLGEHAPVAPELLRWIASSRPPVAPHAPAPAPAAAAQPTPGAVVPALHDAALATPAERAAHLAALGRALVHVGRARFAADAADSGAYRTRRLGASLCCERTPAASRRDRTELDPPPARPRAAVAALLQVERWHDALAQIELLLDGCPLWIEGHFLSARALALLGARHAAAHAVVVREAHVLLARLPGLAALRFADGSPLATDEARRWAEQPSSAPSPDVRAGEPELTGVAPCSVIAGRVARGEHEARAALVALRGSAVGGAARFRIDCALAEALEAAQRVGEAGLLWHGLAQQLVEHRLARWQPEAAVTVLRGLARTQPEASLSDARALRAELALADPLALLDTSILLPTSKGA